MKVTRHQSRARPRFDPRILHLKIRVILRQPMSMREAHKAVEYAARTGIVPPGIDIAWIDWEKGTAGRANSGTVTGRRIAKALRDFYGAITKGDVRFAPVKD